MVTTVREGLELDLQAWEAQSPGISSSSLARLAVALATGIDVEAKSLTAKANAANALRSVLSDLRELLPPAEEADDVDELQARRAKRTSG
jgi:hypothetical protein